ncbi:MAG: metallophosphoesterase [Chloroflexota bacterium]
MRSWITSGIRILSVADLHYQLRQLDWVASVAPDFDLVVLAGDLLDVSSIVAPDAQIAVVHQYLRRLADVTTVVVCSGNHDLDAENAHGERAAGWLGTARDAGVFVDGTSFGTATELVTVCPWWDGPRTRDDVDAQLAADAAILDERRRIWAYHAPPDASPTSWTGTRHYGDEDLGGWIERHSPDLVLCGHVHQSPFETPGGWMDRIGSTVVVNAGRQPGPEPTCIEIDTDAGVASWRSYLGIDERPLTPA